MVGKIVSVMSDGNISEYIWVAVPVIAIILGAIAFAVITMVRSG